MNDETEQITYLREQLHITKRNCQDLNYLNQRLKRQFAFQETMIVRLENPFNSGTAQERGWNYLMEQITEIIKAAEQID
jgi:hypothetical protein